MVLQEMPFQQFINFPIIKTNLNIEGQEKKQRNQKNLATKKKKTNLINLSVCPKK